MRICGGMERMKETEGLACLSCHSVVFSIDTLLKHIIENPVHKYWKYGDADGVVFIKLLKPVR